VHACPVIRVAAGACAVVLCLSGCREASDPGSTGGPSTDSTSLSSTQRVMKSLDVGATAEYDLYAHCGVQFTKIDGLTWRTRLRDDGNGNPPPGWPQVIHGKVERVAADTVIFSSDEIPDRITFHPAPDATYTCA